MTNEEVAAVFDELADRLQARKELIFKIRAYRKAAFALRELPVPVEQYRREHDLQEIPGIGEAIAKKIADLLDTGSFKLLDELRRADAEKG
jgi:DNA polymerase (family 10)